MTLEFDATLRDKGLGNDDKKKILLEVPIGELKGKVEELTRFANKTVTIQVIPQYYSFSIPFDKSTNAPTQEYVVNNDGTIDLIKQEQTQLEVDEKGNIDIENRPFEVTKDIVDEFIRAAKSLEFPGAINPRDVLTRNEKGESFEEIAKDYEMSELSVINELEKAREYYAPYAAAWDKKRNEVVFKENEVDGSPDDSSENVDIVDENEPNDSDNENTESGNETVENQDENADSEDDDPY